MCLILPSNNKLLLFGTYWHSSTVFGAFSKLLLCYEKAVYIATVTIRYIATTYNSYLIIDLYISDAVLEHLSPHLCGQLAYSLTN